MGQSNFVQPGDCIDYTPTVAKNAGDVMLFAGMIGAVTTDLAANEKGSLRVTGVITVMKDNAAIALGADLYWNPIGNPVGGTAGSGAMSTTAAGGTYAGKCIRAAAANDARVEVLLGHSTP